MNQSNKAPRNSRPWRWIILGLCMVASFAWASLTYYFRLDISLYYPLIIWMVPVFFFGIYYGPFLAVLLGTISFCSFILGVLLTGILRWKVWPVLGIMDIVVLLIVTGIVAFLSFIVGFAASRLFTKLRTFGIAEKVGKTIFSFFKSVGRFRDRLRKALPLTYPHVRITPFNLFVVSCVLASIVFVISYFFYRNTESGVAHGLLLAVSAPVLISLYLVFARLLREKFDLSWKITFWATMIPLAASYSLACLSFTPETNRGFQDFTVPTIERVLQKDKVEEASFFRLQGPLWIDFERNVVPELPVVSEAIRKLDVKCQIWIAGDIGGGNEIVVRQIGYRLARKGRKVHLLDLRRGEYDADSVVSFFEGQKKSYLLVNNAGLDLKLSNELLERLAPEVRVVMVSDDIEDKLGPLFYPGELGMIKHRYFQALRVHTTDTAEAMIAKFTEISGTSEKLKILNRACGPYMDNLMLLTWALHTYIVFGRIDEETIHEYVKHWLTVELNNEHEIMDASDILLPICIYSSYYVPVRNRFLTEEFGVKESDLRTLREIGVIEEYDNDSTYLRSYDMRKLLLEVITHDSSLARRTKTQFSDMGVARSWEQHLFSLYLLKSPEHNHLIMGHLKGRSDLSKFLLSDERVQHNILANLREERDLRKIADCLNALRADPLIATKIWEMLPTDLMRSRVEEERNIGNIVYFLDEISRDLFRQWISPPVINASRVLDDINLSGLVLKLTMENDIAQLGVLIGSLRDCLWPKALRHSFDQLISDEHFAQDLRSKIEREEDIMEIADLAHSLEYRFLDTSMSEKIFEEIDVRKLAAKIAREERFFDIAYCLRDLSKAGASFWNQLCEILDMGNILGKTKADPDIMSIGSGLGLWCGIFVVSEENERNMTILSEVIKERIRNEPEFTTIASFLRLFADNSCSAGVKRRLLLNIDLADLKDKMKTEDELRYITEALVALRRIDQEMAQKLLEQLDTEALTEKLAQEPVPKTTKELLEVVMAISQQFARSLVEATDIPVLRSSLLTTGDVYNTGLLLGIIARIDSRKAEDLAKSLYLFLHSSIEEIYTKSPDMVGEWFIGISLAEVNIAYELAEKMNIGDFKEKLGERREFLVGFIGIYAANAKVAEELVETVEMRMRDNSDVEYLAHSVERILICRSLIGENMINALFQIIEDRIILCELEWERLESIRIVAEAYKEDSELILQFFLGIINKERELQRITRYLYKITSVDKELAKELVQEVGIQNLKQRMLEEDSLSSLGIFFEMISSLDEQIGHQIEETVCYRLEQEDDLQEIGYFFGDPGYGNVRARREVLEGLQDTLKSKVEEEDELETIIPLIWTTENIDTAFAIEFLKIVKDKVRDEPRARITSNFIWRLSDDMATWFVAELDTEILEEVVESEPDLRESAGLIRTVGDTGNEMITTVLMEKLKQRVETEKNIEAIGWCFSSLCSTYTDESGQHLDNYLAKELFEALDLENLKTKIGAEHDLNKIMRLAMHFMSVDPEIAETTAGTVLAERINEDTDFVEICSAFHKIVEYCEKGQMESFSEKLLLDLDMDAIKEKMSQDTHVDLIEQFITDVAKLDRELANDVLSSLSTKIPNNLE